MTNSKHIIYTKVDEAPALASYSFLPILQAFLSVADIELHQTDISLAGRVLAQFSDFLEHPIEDGLAALGELTQEKTANIIKLPNISASIPQLKACIQELQAKGLKVPDYPENPKNESEMEIQARYKKVLGSAVNPVLREGNSDRRAPEAVKNYAKVFPHSNKAFSSHSKTRVKTMAHSDFYHNEKSLIASKDQVLKIVLKNKSGSVKVLKEHLNISAGSIIDGTFMSLKALQSFFEESISQAKSDDLLLSLHLKATMMKVSDPIIFGEMIKVYFKDLFEDYAEDLKSLGANAALGLKDLEQKCETASPNLQEAIKNKFSACLDQGPALAMVDSDKGITGLHVSSDVIVDASMPAMIRSGGKMWNAAGQLQDTLAVIPDSSYAGVYHAVVEDCKIHGPLDPSQIGSVPNVGLMAQKAEEYGSHDTTFQIAEEGELCVLDEEDQVLMSHQVESGDIWRMCTVNDAAIQDWVGLAYKRMQKSGDPVIFWLDEARAHHVELIEKVKGYWPGTASELRMLSPEKATQESLKRMRQGLNTISATGNVLRDYNTDLFPILELGTSAKMLSIVPLMKGGGLFETGAGGSAPKHVQQFVKDGHLRWDSLGEMMALAASLEHFAEQFNDNGAQVFAQCLDKAIGLYLTENKAPKRKVGDLDTRGSHVYLALYWAEALAIQEKNKNLADVFKRVATTLAEEMDQILIEIAETANKVQDLGGYYLMEDPKAYAALFPSKRLRALLKNFFPNSDFNF